MKWGKIKEKKERVHTNIGGSVFGGGGGEGKGFFPGDNQSATKFK